MKILLIFRDDDGTPQQTSLLLRHRNKQITFRQHVAAWNLTYVILCLVLLISKSAFLKEVARASTEYIVRLA